MPQITGKILDSAGLPITCKLAVQLDDPLIFAAPVPSEVRTTAAHLFDVPNGDIDISLLESATQRTTYDFHLYIPLESALYYELDGDSYTGPTHAEEGVSYTGSVPTVSRRELFKETLEGQQTLSRFKAIVPIATTFQFSALFGQRVTAGRFVDRGYYQEIIASLPGTTSAINNNAYPTRPELAALQNTLLSLQSRVGELEGRPAGGSSAEPAFIG